MAIIECTVQPHNYDEEENTFGKQKLWVEKFGLRKFRTPIQVPNICLPKNKRTCLKKLLGTLEILFCFFKLIFCSSLRYQYLPTKLIDFSY